MEELIRIHPTDTVAVAIKDLPKGTPISEAGGAVTLENISRGHKVALKAHASGDAVIKYGHVIGFAKENIPVGAHVHTHNLRTGLGDDLEYEYKPLTAVFPEAAPDTFNGFKRANGKVGIRNEVWIIPTVGCVNSLAVKLRESVKDIVPDGVDGVFAFTHPYGCSQMGEDQENTRKILADLIEHPNAGGVLVLGLGCENTSVPVLKEYLADPDSTHIRYLVCQETEDEYTAGIDLLKELLEQASGARREPVSTDKLIVGMKCGGSDGLSGITANPTVGAFSDLLIEHGGTTIMTEVPEFFGAEDRLMNRCVSEEVFLDTVKLINSYKGYLRSHGQTIYENPSPGNKAGGISTLEDKALGNTQKSGSAPVADVLDYGEKAEKNGLNLLWGPGNDGVSVTAMTAAGAQLILFTTGRGTPFAAPAPTLKISTNNELAGFKKNWIDFNAGEIINGETIEECGRRLYDLVLEVAGGKRTRAEELDYHDMAILRGGVTL